MVQDLTAKFVAATNRIAKEKGLILKQPAPHEQSPFIKEAMVVRALLGQIEKKVQKLSTLAKKDGIFDDATVEISELTAVLKKDRDRVEGMIEGLKKKIDTLGSSEHANRHGSSIIKSLEMTLGECTQSFTRALEQRARTMQVQQKKRQAFTGAVPPSGNPFKSAPPSSSGGHVALDMNGEENSSFSSNQSSGQGQQQQQGGGGYMEQELLDLDPQQQQLRAIQQIEQTLVQLGQMFSQFSALVQRQGEQIERIDDQVEQTQSNIQRAQQEILTYYQSIAGNRSLIMKLFGVTAGFLVVFVMFFL